MPSMSSIDSNQKCSIRGKIATNSLDKIHNSTSRTGLPHSSLRSSVVKKKENLEKIHEKHTKKFDSDFLKSQSLGYCLDNSLKEKIVTNFPNLRSTRKNFRKFIKRDMPFIISKKDIGEGQYNQTAVISNF